MKFLEQKVSGANLFVKFQWYLWLFTLKPYIECDLHGFHKTARWCLYNFLTSYFFSTFNFLPTVLCCLWGLSEPFLTPGAQQQSRENSTRITGKKLKCNLIGTPLKNTPHGLRRPKILTRGCSPGSKTEKAISRVSSYFQLGFGWEWQNITDRLKFGFKHLEEAWIIEKKALFDCYSGLIKN